MPNSRYSPFVLKIKFCWYYIHEDVKAFKIKNPISKEVKVSLIKNLPLTFEKSNPLRSFVGDEAPFSNMNVDEIPFSLGEFKLERNFKLTAVSLLSPRSPAVIDEFVWLDSMLPLFGCDRGFGLEFSTLFDSFSRSDMVSVWSLAGDFEQINARACV